MGHLFYRYFILKMKQGEEKGGRRKGEERKGGRQGHIPTALEEELHVTPAISSIRPLGLSHHLLRASCPALC